MKNSHFHQGEVGFNNHIKLEKLRSAAKAIAKVKGIKQVWIRNLKKGYAIGARQLGKGSYCTEKEFKKNNWTKILEMHIPKKYFKYTSISGYVEIIKK